MNGLDGTMTKAIPFTQDSLARAIKGVEKAGRHVVGVKPDGTLIVADKPVDVASLLPVSVQDAGSSSKWEDRVT